MKDPTVTIIGAGQAGAQVALSLREAGHHGGINLVGEEECHPYHRPPLSKAYLADLGMPAERLLLRPTEIFRELGIACHLGRRVFAIERRRARVWLEGGTTLPYDHLVLATGSRNRLLPVPGGSGQNVYYLRTIAEGSVLRRKLSASRDCIVVGAGFIGLETAAVIAKLGLRCTVVDVSDQVMSRRVSTVTADYFHRRHEGRGTALMLKTAVREVGRSSTGRSAVTSGDGRRFEADRVLVGVGVLPNSDLADAAGLAIDDGVVVDETLATADPAISAIGDCASFPDPVDNARRIRIESVQNAIDQARCLAQRLTGAPGRYVATPWFWSDQGDDKLQIVGLAHPGDDVHVRGDPQSGSFSVFRFRDEHLTAVESVNRPADHMTGRLLLTGKMPITAEQVCDPSFDLKALAKRRSAVSVETLGMP